MKIANNLFIDIVRFESFRNRVYYTDSRNVEYDQGRIASMSNLGGWGARNSRGTLDGKKDPQILLRR